MKNPDISASNLVLSNEEIIHLEQQLGKKPGNLEIAICSLLQKSNPNSRLLRATLTESLPKHLIHVDEQKSILCLNNTINVNGQIQYDTNEILLHMAIKGFRLIAQDIAINTSSKQTDAILLNSISREKNMAGIPVFLSKVTIDKRIPCKDFLLSQNTMGIYAKSDVTSQVDNGDLVYYIGFPEEFLYNLGKNNFTNSKIINSSDNSVPLTNRILLEFIHDSSKFIKTGEAIMQTGMLPVISSFLEENNCGMSLEFSNADCIEETGLPKFFLPHNNPYLIIILDKNDTITLKKVCEHHELEVKLIGTIINTQQLQINLNNKITSIQNSVLSTYNKHQENDLPIQFTKKNINFDINTIPEPDDISLVGKKIIEHPGILLRNDYSKLFDQYIGGRILNISPYNTPAIIKTFGDKYAITSASEMIIIDTEKSTETQIFIGISRIIKSTICCGAIPQQINYTYNNTSLKKRIHSIIESVEQLYTIKTGTFSFQPVISTDKCITVNINVIGLIYEKQHYCTPDFKQKGDMVYIIGDPINDIASSLYLTNLYGDIDSPPAYFDKFIDSKLNNGLQDVIRKNLVKSAHIVREGGLFITLIESSLAKNLGFDITIPAEVRVDAFLFGESPLMSLVSVNGDNETEFIDLLIAQGLPFYTLGHVTREELRIDDISLGFILDYKLKYEKSLYKAL